PRAAPGTACPPRRAGSCGRGCRPSRWPRRTASSPRSTTTPRRWRADWTGPCAGRARSRSSSRRARSGPRRRRSAPPPPAPARLSEAFSSLAPFVVHAVDDILVFAIDERPLQLHRGRQLLVLRRQQLLDEPELLDRLHPRELLVDALDLAPDEVLDFPGAAQRGEIGEGHAALLRELRHRLVVDHDQAREELPLIADDHRVGDERRELQLVLDLGRRDVLAAE